MTTQQRPGQQPPQRPPPRVHVDSARVGIRLALISMQGQRPPDDVVDTILRSGQHHIELVSFPIDLVLTQQNERMERRRVSAQRSLEALLHHIPDPTLLTSADMDKLVAKAWHLAAAMESEDNTAQQLDTLKQGPKP